MQPFLTGQDNSYKEMDDEDQAILRQAQPLITDAYNHAVKKFRERRVYNDLYFVRDRDYETYKKDFQAKYLTPQYQSFAEQKICLYAQGITGTDIQPFFIYSAMDNLYAAQPAQALTKMAYVDLMQDYYYETNYKTSQHYVVDGFAIEKPWWNFQTVKNYIPEQKMIIDEFGNPIMTEQITEKEVVIADRPCVKSIAPNDIWVDPAARNEDELRYVVERMIKPFSWCKMMEAQGVYKNVDLMKNVPFPVRGEMDDFLSSVSHQGGDYIEFYEKRVTGKAIDKEDPLIEILTVWHRGYFYVIGQNRIVLSGKRSYAWLKKPFPFVFYSNSPNSYRFDGMSDFYWNRNLIKETNKVGNMLIDNIYRHLNSTYFINGLLPPEDIAAIKSGAGNVVVQSASADLVNQFRPELPSQSVVGFLEGMISSSRDSMGLSDIQAGQSPGSEFRTTGSIQILTQLSNLRNAVKLQLLANRKRDVGKTLLDLYRSFMTEERAITVGGSAAPQLMQISQQDLNLDYNLDINIAPAADILRSQELMAMRALFADMVQLPGFRANNAALQICAKAGLYEDPTSLFDQNILKIEQANALDAKVLGAAVDPQFGAGMNVPSPDAGGTTETNAANQARALPQAAAGQ